MPIILLPKSKVAEQKAKARARDVEEGMKVANRVDGLRELYSKTEHDLEAYRTETLSSIEKEIKELEKKKEILSGEVKMLHEEYDRMLPEIPTKRKELSDFEKSLKSWEKKLLKKQEKVDFMELDVAEAKKKAQLLLSVQKDNERITANLLSQANGKKNEAQQALDTARKIEERSKIDQKEKENELRLREFSILSREKAITSREIALTSAQKENNDEKIRLADERGTLERAMKRLREGRYA